MDASDWHKLRGKLRKNWSFLRENSVIIGLVKNGNIDLGTQDLSVSTEESWNQERRIECYYQGLEPTEIKGRRRMKLCFCSFCKVFIGECRATYCMNGRCNYDDRMTKDDLIKKYGLKFKCNQDQQAFGFTPKFLKVLLGKA